MVLCPRSCLGTHHTCQSTVTTRGPPDFQNAAGLWSIVGSYKIRAALSTRDKSFDYTSEPMVLYHLTIRRGLPHSALPHDLHNRKRYGIEQPGNLGIELDYSMSGL
jgi:hypothetical protein